MAVSNRIGIAVNLPTGATYDLLLIDHPDGYPEGKLDFKFNDTPRKITGIQKVAQYFLKVLLTSRGTDVVHENYGTIFPDLALNANRTGIEKDLYINIVNEVRSAESQSMAVLNTVGADDASMLQGITIIGIDTVTDAIVMYLKLVTVSGTVAQVAVPFPELDMKFSGE